MKKKKQEVHGGNRVKMEFTSWAPEKKRNATIIGIGLACIIGLTIALPFLIKGIGSKNVTAKA